MQRYKPENQLDGGRRSGCTRRRMKLRIVVPLCAVALACLVSGCVTSVDGRQHVGLSFTKGNPTCCRPSTLVTQPDTRQASATAQSGTTILNFILRLVQPDLRPPSSWFSGLYRCIAFLILPSHFQFY